MNSQGRAQFLSGFTPPGKFLFETSDSKTLASKTTVGRDSGTDDLSSASAWPEAGLKLKRPAFAAMIVFRTLLRVIFKALFLGSANIFHAFMRVFTVLNIRLRAQHEQTDEAKNGDVDVTV